MNLVMVNGKVMILLFLIMLLYLTDRIDSRDSMTKNMHMVSNKLPLIRMISNSVRINHQTMLMMLLDLRDLTIEMHKRLIRESRLIIKNER